MQVILAAMGGGAPGTMTAECAGALAAAECVVGARRLLAALPAGCTARRVEAARPQEVLQGVWLDNMLAAGKISKLAYEKVCRKNAEQLLGL